MEHRRWLALVCALVLALAACGGGEEAVPADDPDSAPAGDTGDTGNEASDDDGEPVDPPPAEPSDDGGAPPPDVDGVGEATLTLNGETYFFGDDGFPVVRCEPDMFGVFFVVLQRVDEQGNAIEGGGGIEMVLLQPGTDPDVLDQRNEARAQLNELDEEWIADEEDIAERELEAGTSQVDFYTIDGTTVNGTATFYEENSYWASVGNPDNEVLVTEGEFQVTCAEE